MRAVTSVLLSCAVAGCVAGDTDEDSFDADSQATTCVAVKNRSLIETDRTNVVTETAFGMRKVFDAIRTSTPAGVTIPTTNKAMFQELYAAFANCTSSSTIDPNGYGLKCRPAEASLATVNPFTTTPGAAHYTPVALVNRFDLAPSDFSYCGESRIVYWKTSSVPAGRASIIVEMRTPAVVLANGTRTCAPVAQFWANLSNVTDVTKRAARLQSFYFNGLPGMPFPPVSARGVGFGGAGQVRLNSFINQAEWNLREFKWQKVCVGTACSAHFVEQPTKNNPSQLLFTGAHPKAALFQTWFVNTATPALAAATNVNQLALGNANGFNTFESISGPVGSDPTDVNYAADVSDAFRTQIQAKLTEVNSPLSVDNILARAETQTCAGCHQLSNLATLGGGLTWPSSGFFVQIDESGTPSTAMTTQFLPHRAAVLQSFVCGGGTAPASDPNITIDGLPTGAAN